MMSVLPAVQPPCGMMSFEGNKPMRSRTLVKADSQILSQRRRKMAKRHSTDNIIIPETILRRFEEEMGQHIPPGSRADTPSVSPEALVRSHSSLPPVFHPPSVRSPRSRQFAAPLPPPHPFVVDESSPHGSPLSLRPRRGGLLSPSISPGSKEEENVPVLLRTASLPQPPNDQVSEARFWHCLCFACGLTHLSQKKTTRGITDQGEFSLH